MEQIKRDAFWRDHVDAFLRQRASQRDYCYQHGISERVLRKWRTKFYGAVRQPGETRMKGSGPEPTLREFAYPADQDSGPPTRASSGTLVLRRRWTDDQKRQLVWEGLNSGKPLAQFAKRHDIHPSVMHRWLKEFARPALAAGSQALSAFADVRIAETPLLASSATLETSAVSPPDNRACMIEIDLPSGRRIRVGADVDADALRRVVSVLEKLA